MHDARPCRPEIPTVEAQDSATIIACSHCPDPLTESEAVEWMQSFWHPDCRSEAESELARYYDRDERVPAVSYRIGDRP